MDTPKIFESEHRFCQILWEREPVSSTELVRLCREKLGWKKSTTYTVLKKLVDRGILRNENAVVSAAVPREAVLREESRSVVDRAFDGSLPSFLAHFMGGRTISDQEADELKAIIDRFREGEGHD